MKRSGVEELGRKNTQKNSERKQMQHYELRTLKGDIILHWDYRWGSILEKL